MNTTPPIQTIQLVIQFTPGKPVIVSGPLQDKQFCYGLLEMARDVIKDFVPPQIQIAPPGLVDQIKKHDDHRHP